MEQRCLVADCDSTSIHLRGICRSCYTYAAQLVRFNLATWEQLEASGAVGRTNGAVQSPKRPIRTEWFSRAIGMTPDMLAAEVHRMAAFEYSRRRIGTRRHKKGSNGSSTNQKH